MSKSLHGWTRAKDGRIILGDPSRDTEIRKSPDAIQRARERRERRAKKIITNIIKSYEGRGIKIAPTPNEQETDQQAG
jgi:hypothetical protein